jgi:RNA polymerase sigma factor (sigma-70 family)
MAGERPVDPRLFSEWEQLLRKPVDVDVDREDRVREAIERLPDRQRDVVNGVFYEGVPKTVLAERLQVSRHEVRRLYVDALRKLEEELACA